MNKNGVRSLEAFTAASVLLSLGGLGIGLWQEGFASGVSSLVLGISLGAGVLVFSNLWSAEVSRRRSLASYTFLQEFAQLESAVRGRVASLLGKDQAEDMRFLGAVEVARRAGYMDAESEVAIVEALRLRNILVHSPDPRTAIPSDLADRLQSARTTLSRETPKTASPTKNPISLLRSDEPYHSKPDFALARALRNEAENAARSGDDATALKSILECTDIFALADAADRRVLAIEIAACYGIRSEMELRVGNTERSVRTATDALEVLDEYGDQESAEYKHARGAALNNASNRYSDVGRSVDALKVAEEAVFVLRELTETVSPRYIPDLLRAQNTLINRLLDVQRPEEAAMIAAEAANSAERLAGREPDHRHLLARIMGSFAQALYEIGQRSEALEAARRSVQLREELVELDPEKNGDDLAISLTNLSAIEGYLGLTEAALEHARRAVEVRRGLPGQAIRRREHLSNALNNVAALLVHDGRTADAIGSMREAVELRRGLYSEVPQRYRVALADALNNLVVLLARSGESEEALEASREALATARLAVEDEIFGASEVLATALNNYSVRASKTGDPNEALRAVSEAVEIRTSLYQENPGKYASALSMALAGRASRLIELERTEEALDPSRQARLLREALFREAPRAIGWLLVRSLRQERDIQRALGNEGEATDLDERVRDLVEGAEDRPGDEQEDELSSSADGE